MTPGVVIGGPATGPAERPDRTRVSDHWPSRRLPVVFGPVRSRRLGWSLGINNVPAKACSYACIYCQIGNTTRARIGREPYLDPDAVARIVRRRVRACRNSRQPVDYAAFVPNGEPTLDVNLGRAIRAIRGLGVRVAVISNASLLWREDVRDDLLAADWVSLKIDTVDEPTWRSLNRPVRRLGLSVILAGIERFAEEYRGYLATETMLVEGVNDDEEGLLKVARYVRSLAPSHAYVAVPVRPTSESWARQPLADVARQAAGLFAGAGLPTTLLGCDQADAGFAQPTDAVEGLIGILAVHPMSERAARAYVRGAGEDWRLIEELIDDGTILPVTRGRTPYLRLDHARTGRMAGTGPSPVGQRTT